MRFRSFLIVLALVSLYPLGVFAAGVAGVTDTEVVVGVTTPLSGPAALWGVTGQGMKAWADYVNDQGGVNGRKIKVVLKDDAYNPTRALANLQEMKGEAFAVCGLLGTAILNASKDFFQENKIPLITAYGDVRIWAALPREKLEYVFIAYPDYEDEAEYLTTYGMKKLDSKKLALFYQNDDYGKMALSGIKKALEAMPGKAELVSAVPYEVTERALGTHALKLKESGADTLLVYTTPTHGALILKEIAKLAYKPKVLTTFTLGDPIMYKVAGEVWEGTYIALPGNSGVPGSEANSDRVADILKKYDPKIAGKEYLALFGAVSMMHFVEGLKHAGKELTPASLIKGMEKIKDWKPEGIGAPVTYAPDRRHGVNASRMSRATDGKHVPLEEFTIFKPRF
ncbi:MAG: ABC transporter substrate-binding protein [Desulfomonile tiedjei]|uniref:ABC transporter substrate-binding protein n=1 Tax=Desulfomonile tiedjei TaxID=2358 RepID=A0A9D6V2X3_9BACT|nr:ABC transporter substrate-binding protein [Desulfomonile tiedjei]